MPDWELERFWDKVEVQPNGCWNYNDTLTARYSRFKEHGKNRIQGHNFAYEINKGKIPNGLQLDHLCRNRKCVNPDHLEPVTPRINVLRSTSIIAINAIKTHCPKGHPLSGYNLYSYKNRRHCRTCRRENKRFIR